MDKFRLQDLEDVVAKFEEKEEKAKMANVQHLSSAHGELTHDLSQQDLGDKIFYSNH